MDKFRDDAILAYDQGTRAYVKPTGSIFQKSDGSQVSVRTWPLWESLRAYQDEQRKKGEPIRWPQLKDRKKWYANTYEEFRFECINDMPCIDVHKNVIGGFKNFRWRPGHGPKGGSNE